MSRLMLIVREEAYAVFPSLEDAIGCLTTTICVRNCVELSFECTCGISCRMAEELSVIANDSGTIFTYQQLKNFVEFIA